MVTIWDPLAVLLLLCGTCTGGIGQDYQTVYMSGSCGLSFSLSESGYISWSSSENYGNNEDCSVVFYTSVSGAVIYLQFSQINIEGSDRLYIYNGDYHSTPSNDYVAVANGNVPGQFVSTGQYMTLRLASDGSAGGAFTVLYTRMQYVGPSVALTADTIRLVGGSVLNEGRVEIRRNTGSDWGTVCDDGFDMTDADVVCRSLGYSGAQEVRASAGFGQGSGSIFMDDVACSGTETSLIDCPSEGWGDHNCGHHEDVGVVCQLSESMTSSCSDFLCGNVYCMASALECDGVYNCGDRTDENCANRFRLVDGGTSDEGRLEVRPADSYSWGTVCDDLFDMDDASVACRTLGYSWAITFYGSAHFGEGSGDIYMDDLACSGEETSLLDCSYAGWGVENCRHLEDVGVVCSNENPDSGVQLSGGAIAGIVIGVLVGVGLLAVFVHHYKKTSSQPTPANRVRPNQQTVTGMNNTTFHRPTVVSQNPPAVPSPLAATHNPPYNPHHQIPSGYQPYPPPQQYAPPPSYDTALNMPRQPPSGFTSHSYSSQNPAYAPPPEPFRYGVT